MLRISVDEQRCQGHGRCYELVPELFEPDNDGHSVGCSASSSMILPRCSRQSAPFGTARRHVLRVSVSEALRRRTLAKPSRRRTTHEPDGERPDRPSRARQRPMTHAGAGTPTRSIPTATASAIAIAHLDEYRHRSPNRKRSTLTVIELSPSVDTPDACPRVAGVRLRLQRRPRVRRASACPRPRSHRERAEHLLDATQRWPLGRAAVSGAARRVPELGGVLERALHPGGVRG